MSVRSKRLFGPTVVGTAQVIVYTAPAGETALVKLVTMVNVATLGATQCTLTINGTSSSFRVCTRNVPNGGDTWVEGFLVLQAGDVLRAQAFQASVIVAGFGAELEGVAD